MTSTASASQSESPLDRAASIFRSLGYDITLRPIDLREWPASLSLGEARVSHAFRRGRLDIYFIETSDEVATVAAFGRALRERNAVRRPLLVSATTGADHFSLLNFVNPAAPVRLDIPLRGASAEVLERLASLAISAEEESDPVTVIDRAMSRESITSRFFQRFRTAVRRASTAYAGLMPGEEKSEVDSQALLILSRLLFLYFIQQKGWLDGSRRFVSDHFDRAVRNGENFHATVLSPLFFDCLNTPRQARAEAASRLGAIPYLNGGLFHPSAFERRHPAQWLPNEVFEYAIDELFERFWFSVDEGEVRGLHVDPEMLGRVFESLMAADDRLSSGSFYTPKEVVDRMVERAIAAWCSDGDDVVEQRIRGFWRGEELTLSRADAQRLVERLRSIRLLDPACGSGAFLLGALYAIEKLTKQLHRIAEEELPPALRQSIVEQSLFGVDLTIEAVRLCELRLWLAIVSTSESSIEAVPPLPNLDRNVYQGNSLVAPVDFLAAARRDVYTEWAFALRARAKTVDFYRHALPAQKGEMGRLLRDTELGLARSLVLRTIELESAEPPSQQTLAGMEVDAKAERFVAKKRIAAARATLRRLERGECDFFAYDIQMSHILADGGFNVVVGNPPWVRHARIDPELRLILSERYRYFGSDGAFQQSDLALPFCEKAVDLLAPGGVASLLLPSKTLTARYAAAMRNDLTRRCSILSVDDWSHDKSLFSADVFPMALTVRRSPPETKGRVEISGELGSFSVDHGSLARRPSGWVLIPPEIERILSRLEKRFAPLTETLGRNPLMGVKTGANDLFFVGELSMERGTFRTAEGVELPPEALCRVARGRDLRRWRLNSTHWMLWPPPGGWRQVPPWLGDLAARRGVSLDSTRLSWIRPEHLGTKVVWKDLSPRLQAVVLPPSVHIGVREFPLIANQTTYLLDAASTEEAWFLSAVLNSSVFGALVLQSAERAKDAHFRYYGVKIGAAPLPLTPPSAEERRELVRMARRAHAGDDVQTEVDALVARLYGVSGNEERKLARFLARKTGG